VFILSRFRFFSKIMRILFIILSIFVFICSFIINFEPSYCAEKTQAVQNDLVPLTQKDITTFKDFPVNATTSSMIGKRFIDTLYCEKDFEFTKALREKFLPF